jgi:hypothetical protein
MRLAVKLSLSSEHSRAVNNRTRETSYEFKGVRTTTASTRPARYP